MKIKEFNPVNVQILVFVLFFSTLVINSGAVNKLPEWQHLQGHNK